MLAGRDRERVAVRHLLDQARDSRGASLVLHGVPGVGKSTLLDHAAIDAQADGFTVLRTSGIESESPLAFAALQRLLRPVLRLADRLPEPQARALRRAFGVEEGEVDRFLVFLAALSLLAEAAEESPVLSVVDDAHWLDDASAAALLFVARRLQVERVALLFAARDGDVRRFDADDLPDVALRELDAADAGALLAATTGAVVPREVLDRLVHGTGGNPLALVELGAALSPDQLTGQAPLPSDLPLTAGVERVFLDRVHRLPSEAQTLLLVAAADDSGRATIVRHAARALGASSNAIVAAEASGLVQVVGDTVRFRHPLVRSAVYGAATNSQRREAHRALADALIDSGDLDRRAWHRAAAAEEPDESVVAALDDVAERASQRGGWKPPRPHGSAPQSSPSPPNRERRGCSRPPEPRGRAHNPVAPALSPRRRAPPATTSCCSPTSTVCAPASNGTSAPAPWATGSCSRPRATSLEPTPLGPR